ncbi:phage tail protein, partial [Candidatus Falkowbacteria bacterium]
ATANGTYSLYIGGTLVATGVATGDTADAIATATAAAINANTNLQVTAAAVADTVTTTSKNKGPTANQVIFVENFFGAVAGQTFPAGVTTTLVQPSGGATAPDLTAAIAALGDLPFDAIGIPFDTAVELDALKTEIDRRWSPTVLIYGHVFAALTDTISDLWLFGNTRNNPHETVAGADPIAPSPSMLLAAAWTGQAAVALAADPAAPLQTLALNGYLGPISPRSYTDRNSLLGNGIATSTVIAGQSRIERSITTYQKDGNDQPSTTWLDVQTPFTLARITRRLQSRILTTYPRHKLANNGTPIANGQRITTPNMIKGLLVDEYAQTVIDGLCENPDLFKLELVVVRDGSDPNRINVVYPADLVNQLRVSAFRVDFTV